MLKKLALKRVSNIFSATSFTPLILLILMILGMIYGSITYASVLKDLPCTPFRSRIGQSLPPPPVIVTPVTLPQGWEERLVNSITEVKTQSSFAQIYREFLMSNTHLSEADRYRWLSCISYYTHLKASNQAAKWTGIVDHRLSRVIYPVNIDEDLGVSETDVESHKIPSYLKISNSRPVAAQLQRTLFNEFGVLAIDHTDRQSDVVLKQLLFLLQNSLGDLVRRLPSFHYLYAFSGHDPAAKIAAYHHEVKAISVGGVLSYRHAPLSSSERIELLAALAHEIGHAFVFDHMAPAELESIAARYGHWRVSQEGPAVGSFYAPVFFQPFWKKQLLYQAENSSTPEDFLKRSSMLENLTTQYAAKNIHEWFAEAFAGKVLNDLGRSGLLGRFWQKSLIKYPNQKTYWTNYNNINSAFTSWLEQKIQGILNQAGSKNAHFPGLSATSLANRS